MTPEQFDERLDGIILDLVHRGSMMPRGKTINAGMFPDAKSVLRQLIGEGIGEDEPNEIPMIWELTRDRNLHRAELRKRFGVEG